LSSLEKSYGVVDPEIVGNWLSSIDVSQSTKRDYELGFRTWCDFVSACAYDFDSLEEQHVLDFKSWLQDERKLSPAAVSLYLNGVRSFYRHAESRDLKNIAANVRGAKAPRGFMKSNLSLVQAKELLALFKDANTEKDARDKAIISLMLHTGLRDIEVIRANVSDLGSSGGFEILSVQGKGRDTVDDFVKITPTLSEDIRHYLSLRKSKELDSPLFTSVAKRNFGKRLTARSVSRIVKTALRRCGIDDPRYTAHSLRHSAITFALLGGAELEDVQAMARHANISTTMIYSHHVDRLAHAGEDYIAELLDI